VKTSAFALEPRHAKDKVRWWACSWGGESLWAPAGKQWATRLETVGTDQTGGTVGIGQAALVG
jgi:hypothetical protein